MDIINIIKTNKLKLFQITAIDILHFILFSIIYTYFFERMIFLLGTFQDLATKKINEIVASGTDSLPNTDLSAFLVYYDEIIKLTFYLAVIFLVLWLAFQSFSWFITLKIVRKHITFKPFLKQFASITTIYYLIFTLIVYLLVKMSFTLTKAMVNILRPEYLGNILLITMFIFFYLTITAYTVIKKRFAKNYLRKLINLRHIMKFILAALIIVTLIILHVKIVTALMFKVHILILGPLLLLIFPIIAILKVYLCLDQ